MESIEFMESMSYSWLTAAVGVSVVFFSLLALCLLMYILNSLFAGKETVAVGVKAPAGAAGSPQSQAVSPDHQWLCAAVAVFLARETEQAGGPVASKWPAKAAGNWDNQPTFVRNNRS